MQTGDDKRFAAVIAKLTVVFDREISKPLQRAYWDSLADLDIEEVESAASQAIANGRFFPKPAELREYVCGNVNDRALLAWQELEAKFKRHGYWTSVMFEDGAIAEAIERVFGGWVACSEFLHTESDEMIRAKQKQFEAVYRLAARVVQGPRYLRGYCEIENLNTQGTWTRGSLPAGVESEQPLRSLPPPVRMLSAGTEVDVTEGREIIEEAVSNLTALMRAPRRDALSEAEYQARRAELERQAEALRNQAAI